MAKRFTTVWGDGARPPVRGVATRPAAAGAETDAESGSGDDTLRQSLRALRAMRDRGLMSEEEYERHRADTVARAGRPQPG
ncbi:SHOCT domain-containing protein [Azospirillum sp. RWY-5-1]|uniref:SHOCT domain-containing protein n=1 Tax=Azospirillum oleiclasticum TaxID=2735135 RepID=A0ABX2TFK4_9PROT|nr:SHOCT domain-containing protein [Azospirillum oleiclasticum]NYZ15697.1 SHOCT domain-containing protein [Azospirillum oleiclasticum]NYZ21967.1 SHOCT domain-containing protein [Azospirillum oleiclasticum]